MALSGACFEFLQATADAADVLAAVHHYSAPHSPIAYGGQMLRDIPANVFFFGAL
jgi:hypothetical protein